MQAKESALWKASWAQCPCCLLCASCSGPGAWGASAYATCLPNFLCTSVLCVAAVSLILDRCSSAS